MSIPEAVRFTTFERRWLSEAIRLREAAEGPLADRDASSAARASTGDGEARILLRAEQLAQREGMGAAIHPWWARARLGMVAMSIVAVLGGFGAALAVLGDGSRAVNVVWALGGLLGPHLLSLFLWCVGLWLGGRGSGGALGRGWLWLAGRFGGAAEVYLARALTGMLGRAGLLRWWLATVTHCVWTLALLGALMGLLVTLSARRYGFVWETTILSASVFVDFVQVAGWLPAQGGFLLPDAATVQASSGAGVFDEPARLAWSSWFIGCVVVYGVIPRLLLWALSFFLWRQGRSALRLDLGLPYYASLLGRLAPASERIGVTDAAPKPFPGARVAGPHRTESGEAILVGLEMSGNSVWPPRLPAGVRDAGIVDSREQRKRTLERLRAGPPSRLLVACDARLSPDRGSLEMIAEMSRYAGECRVWLVQTEVNAQAERLLHWRNGLQGIELPEEGIIEDERVALNWLGGRDD